MLARISTEAIASAIVSQSPPNTFASDLLVNLIPNLGVLSILVWFLHHTVKYTIPELNEAHNKAMQAVQSDHRATIKDLTEKFDVQLREERATRQQEIKDLAGAIRELKSK